ncbi:MAG: anti-sigma factor family protein [Microcystaceae cyanobacterium]
MKSEFENGRLSFNSDHPEESLSQFELLSAYIDGEVTPKERNQVQEWLDTDPQLKQVYLGLLRLQQDISLVPVPTPAISTEQLSQRVFQRIEKENRFRRLWFWGGMAVTAVLVGAFSSLFLDRSPFSISPQQAQIELEAEPLMIALNQSAIDLPPEVN